jgi:carboxypeptidase Taq
MNAQDAYDELVRRMREQALLSSCEEVLAWDELTYMPPGGLAHRAEQQALLAGLNHERATDPRLGELLAALDGSDLVRDPESAAALVLRDMRWAHGRMTRLPRSLVEESARVTSVAEQEWATARRKNDFGHFQPWLARVVRLKRQEAECYGYNETPYDALLEDYEYGVRTTDLVRLFEALRRELVPLVAAVAEEGRPRHVDVLHRDYPVERQRDLAAAAAEALGYDLRRGRIDDSVHPFSSFIGPGDCRITARYRRRDFTEGFFCVLHETGHALYDQGLPAEHFGTPLGVAASVGVHESQARLWENTVGRCRPFWQHFFPLARRAFPEALGDVDLDTFYRAVNHVEPGVNRVRADECTYNLHILVRFELETALLSGSLAAADLPAAWAEAYRRYLGVTPADDAEGCLQDGHWGAGLIGYFPTYAVGNVYAARLFARAAGDLGDPGPAFARGDFRELLDWLRRHVHGQGQRYTGPDLMKRLTGAALDPGPLLASLRDRQRELGAAGKMLP